MTWDLIGHTWASDLLTRHIVHKSLRHAYLITGPSGVGRRTLALRLAQALSCTNPPEPGCPCLKCNACQRIERGQHPDLSITQADQAGGVIKVEQVRELQHSLSLTPYEAKYRIALLLRFEESHPSASNALLKTLEEPNPQVILILTAESAESVLPTIASRCEIVRLRPVSLVEISSGLQARGIEADLADLCAHISGGLPGYALKLAKDDEARHHRREWLADMHQLCGANRVERFDYIQSLTKNADKEVLGDVLQLWGSFWRDITLRANGSVARITNLDWEPEINAFANQVNAHESAFFLGKIDQAIANLRSNVNPRLSLEVLMLNLPYLRVDK